MCELPTYDLMREHGVVNRICLLYETENPEKIQSAAGIVREFIEDYHEPMEERYIFPHIETETDLVKTLIRQHKKSRKMTTKILSGKDLVDTALDFADMYRWHATMEDTVIFEEFTHITPVKTQKKINTIFEKSETDRFGRGAIGKYLKMLDDIEFSE